MRKMSSHRISLLGIFFALMIVLSFFENALLPELPFLPPGARPGLSNIVIMLTAAVFGPFPTFFMITLKALFVFLTRGGSAFFMSLTGGLLSGAVMVILIRADMRQLSFIGIGMLSAVSHNAGQLLVSMLYTGTVKMIYYFPVLIVFGVIGGALTGLILNIVFPGFMQIIHSYRRGGLYE